jgi:hypothetical protein
MSALALSCLIFVLTLGGILLGTVLRRALPEHHLSTDSQDVVRLGTGLIGTKEVHSRHYEALASHVIGRKQVCAHSRRYSVTCRSRNLCGYTLWYLETI